MAARAADIRICIHCFTACGKPFGAAGRALAVSCGVGLNNCRGCCGGCGGCITAICRGIMHCFLWCLKTCVAAFKVLLVVAFILAAALLIYVYRESISGAFDSVRNSTLELYDKTRNDSNVLLLVNRTNQYYDAAKGKLTELGQRPEVEQVGNKTLQLYDAAKNSVVDAYGKIAEDENVQRTLNQTANLFSSIKGKIWGIWQSSED